MGLVQISGPMTELTRSNAQWRWEKAQEESFLDLKIALATAPVLRLPDFDHQFVVTTDASDVAAGGHIATGTLEMDCNQLHLPAENCNKLKYAIQRTSVNCLV